MWCSARLGRPSDLRGNPGRVWSCLTETGLTPTVWTDTSTHTPRRALQMDDVAVSEAAARDALSRGDRRRALALLMGLYGKPVFSFCRHMLRDTTLADDVLQTTFVQAFSDFRRYRGESSLGVWLHAIARHRCLDMLKMQRRENTHLERTETPGDAEADGPSAEDRLHLASISRHLKDCLGGLPLEVREAVVLRFIQQMSYEEMAGVMGERAATLQMRVARAMSGLKKCLEASGVTL
jgi:RNA polymerase sigma-70 factor, ECF subfamily